MSCHDCSSSSSACGKGSRLNFIKFRQHKRGATLQPTSTARVALVGMPNVGKSVLFNALTGAYVTVSNYPGTTVEVSTGLAVVGDTALTVIDTPGMYSLVPITEEEQVARDLLLEKPIDLVIHVVDAKNLGRMLPLTFQLMEAGFPLLLAVNMMDEAQRLGIKLDADVLAMELGIPIVPMAATLNVGLRDLRNHLLNLVQQSSEMPLLA